MCGAWRLWHNMVTNNEEGVQLVRFHYPKRPEGICPDGKFRRQGARTPLLSRLAGPTTHYKNETLAIAPFRMLVTILCHSLHAPHTSTCPPYTRRPHIPHTISTTLSHPKKEGADASHLLQL